MRRQVEVSKPKPKPKPFYQRKTKTMKLEVVATHPVGRHRRLANGSSSAVIAPVALTQPTPNSEEPKDLAALNAQLLAACVAHRDRTISGKSMTVGEASQ